MKLKHPIKITGLLMLLLVSTLPADAQGVVHLDQGGSYLFFQPTLVRVQTDESGRTNSVVQLGFMGDLVALGDSLQVDVLSSPTSPTSLATSTASNPPLASDNKIIFSWPDVPWIWYPPDGAVRVTMLAGSVDVASVTAIVTSRFAQGTYAFSVPEPGSSLLLLFSGAVLGGRRWINRRTKQV